MSHAGPSRSAPAHIAKRANWRRAKKKRACQAFSRSATPLRQPREMAEWVEFPEKYAHLDHLEAPFGGGGSPGLTGDLRWGGVAPACGHGLAQLRMSPPVGN